MANFWSGVGQGFSNTFNSNAIVEGLKEKRKKKEGEEKLANLKAMAADDPEMLAVLDNVKTLDEAETYMKIKKDAASIKETMAQQKLYDSIFGGGSIDNADPIAGALDKDPIGRALSGGGGLKPKSFSMGGFSFDVPETEDQKRQKIIDEATKNISKEAAEQVGKKQVAESMAKRNVSTVGSAMAGLAQTFVDATKEGAAGNIYKKKLGDIALSGIAGSGVQKNLGNTAAYPGQKVEVVAKIMPMLTQQGDKEGSVRLVSTVFDKLTQSLPDLEKAPEPAAQMMAATFKNMYGFYAAVQNSGGMNAFVKKLGLDPDTLEKLSDDAIAELAQGAMDDDKIKIGLTEDQEKEREELLAEILKPFDDLVGGSAEKKLLLDKYGLE